MFVCLYNEETKALAHEREIAEEELFTEWPLYELEAANRGGPWRPYKGEVPFAFPGQGVSEQETIPDSEVPDED